MAGLSFMATGDYQRLRERYGPHLVDGSAGGTLLIAHPGLAGHDLSVGVSVQDQAGSVALRGVGAAEPCVEFSAMRIPSDSTQNTPSTSR